MRSRLQHLCTTLTLEELGKRANLLNVRLANASGPVNPATFLAAMNGTTKVAAGE
jgi:hypothetical protein